MEKEFIPYTLSLELKELGFDEPCFGYYDGNLNLQFMYNGIPEKFTEKRMGPADSVWVGWISAPTFSQAFRFIREKYGIKTYVYEVLEERFVFITYTNQLDYKMSATYHPTYEEAELECLKKLISIVKEK